MTSGTTWANDPFAIRESRPSLSFKGAPPNTVKQGVVVSIDPDVQGKDTDGNPDTWKRSGAPKLSIVIGLDTDEGPASFWVPKYSKNAKFKAMVDAQQELGRVLQVGDTLKVLFTGVDPATANDPLPTKLYRIKIEPGAVGSTSDPFATPAGQPDNPPF